MRKTLSATVVAVVILAIGVASAQTKLGTVVGTVRDPTAALIPGVQITLLMDKKEIAKAVSDRLGRYEVIAPEGSYEIKAELPGFETLTFSVSVKENIETRVDLVLQIRRPPPPPKLQ